MSAGRVPSEILKIFPTAQSGRSNAVVRLSALLTPLLAILNGCVVSASHLLEIHPGMSRGQVLATLGKPFAAESKGVIESLFFNLSVGSKKRPLNLGKAFSSGAGGRQTETTAFVSDRLESFPESLQ